MPSKFSDAVLQLRVGEVNRYGYAAKVWCKVAPAKVEMFVWFLVLGKLNTKDRLVHLNVIDSANVNCVLCNEHEESIQHLFFSCKVAWLLWISCLNK